MGGSPVGRGRNRIEGEEMTALRSAEVAGEEIDDDDTVSFRAVVTLISLQSALQMHEYLSAFATSVC